MFRPRDVDNQKVFAGYGTKRQIRRRKFLRHPVVSAAGEIQNMFFAEIVKQLFGRYALRIGFSFLKGKLIGGTFDVPQQDVEIIRVNERIFRRTCKEILRMVDNILVKRRRRCNQNRQRCILSPPCTACLLPCAGNRTGIAAEHACIQLSDIDAQLQRVGGNHCADFTLAQTAFDFAPQRGQITATIAADSSRVAKRVFDTFFQMTRQYFDCQTGFAENDCRNIVIH